MDFSLKKDTLHTTIAGTAREIEAARLVSLIRGTPIETGLLIPAVRWISANHRAIILERPVHTTTIEFTSIMGYEEPKYVAYTLPIPWTVTAMIFGPELRSVEEVRMYVRNRHLTPAGTDVLGVPPYPNFYATGEACLGGDFHAQYQQWYGDLHHAPTLMEAFMAANDVLWNSRWNAEVSVWLMPWRLPPQLNASLRGGPSTVDGPAAARQAYNEQLSNKVLYAMSRTGLLAITEWTFPKADGDLAWLINLLAEAVADPVPSLSNLLTKAALD